VQLDLAHLEWRGVPVSKQVPDQSTVLVYGARSAAVGNSGRLNNGSVCSEIVDNPHETIVEAGEAFAKDRVKAINVDACCFV
jgi:hypothetical protein